MNVKDRTPSILINSLKDFVQYIEAECVDFDTVLFRGQLEDWSLLPKLSRIKLRLQSSVLEAEEDMLNHLKRRSIPHLNKIPENDWEWLSLAQHHGMATRMLDWTTNPLAALWFAINEPSADNKDAVVWVFSLEDIKFIKDRDLGIKSPFKEKITRVYQPKHVTNRITTQQGWFTVHSYDDKCSNFIALEKDKRYSKKLAKLTIPADKFEELRFHLDRLGTNAYSIFPDLDGLCKDTEWQFTTGEDES